MTLPVKMYGCTSNYDAMRAFAAAQSVIEDGRSGHFMVVVDSTSFHVQVQKRQVVATKQ